MGSGEKSEELAAQSQVPIPFNEHRSFAPTFVPIFPLRKPALDFSQVVGIADRESQVRDPMQVSERVVLILFDIMIFMNNTQQITEQNNRSVCSRSLRGPELVDLCRLFLVKNTLKYCFNKKEKLNENLISKFFLKVFIINKPIKLNISHFLLMIMLLVHEPHKFLFLTFLAKLFN